MERFSWHRWVRSLAASNARTVRKARPLALENLEARETPATFTWDGGSTSSARWSDRFNWVGDVAPTGITGRDDQLVFPSGAVNGRLNTIQDIKPAGQTAAVFGSITIGGNGYVLTGTQPLILGDSTIPSSNGALTLNATSLAASVGINITLGVQATNPDTNQSITVGAGSTLTYTGSLSGPANIGLQKGGQGTLVFASANGSLGGKISVNEGALRIQNPGALGTTTAGTTVAANAQLQLVGPGIVNEPLSLIGNGGGPGLNPNGALLNVTGTNRWLGPITLDGDTTIGAEGATTLDIVGSISDTGEGRNLTKEGTGTVQLSSANSYRGITTVNNGVLRITNRLALGAADGAIGTGTVVTQSIGKAGTLEIEAPAVPDPDDFVPALSPFVVVNELLTLNGNGGNQLTRGALHASQGNIGWTGNVNLGSPAPDTRDVTILVDGGSLLTIGSGVQFIGQPAGDGIVQAPFAAGVVLNKTGIGTLGFTSNNTYDGFTNIREGGIEISDSNGLGTLGAAGGTQVFDRASLILSVDSITDSVTASTDRLIISEQIDIQGVGQGALGAIRSKSGINEYAGDIFLNDIVTRASIGVDADPSPTNTAAYFNDDYKLTITGDITGGIVDTQGGGPFASHLTLPRYDTEYLLFQRQTLVKVGTGQLVLPSANNTYSGDYNIREGWVTVGDSQSFGPRRTTSHFYPHLE
ncbi:MAG: autotransporter-associated beta strand repeat-containing protein, partial [Gemmataceae bacterium]